MTKTLSKFTFPGEFKAVHNKVKSLGKTVRVISKLFEVNGASSKSSKEIDEAVIIAFGENSPEELNGLLISDPTNHYLLIRQNGTWEKFSTKSFVYTEPSSLEHSWENYEPGIVSTFAYGKDREGFVHIKGIIKNGENEKSAFILPKTFRPKGTEDFITWTVGVEGLIQIKSNGEIIPHTSKLESVSLSGINFLAEQ